jgi:hypothetical protein
LAPLLLGRRVRLWLCPEVPYILTLSMVRRPAPSLAAPLLPLVLLLPSSVVPQQAPSLEGPLLPLLAGLLLPYLPPAPARVERQAGSLGRLRRSRCGRPARRRRCGGCRRTRRAGGRCHAPRGAYAWPGLRRRCESYAESADYASTCATRARRESRQPIVPLPTGPRVTVGSRPQNCP